MVHQQYRPRKGFSSPAVRRTVAQGPDFAKIDGEGLLTIENVPTDVVSLDKRREFYVLDFDTPVPESVVSQNHTEIRLLDARTLKLERTVAIPLER